ncbi:MAG: hypothetical protein N2510_09905 [Ignavibacteria bacterium]|nr:hypothetical protein [Ignavibacteria bacterium]
MRTEFLKTVFLLLVLTLISGCFPASRTEDDETSEKDNVKEEVNKESESSAIINTAKIEQENPMYSPEADSTYLYWLDNKLALLKGYTKCNIFALNVLHKSGYKTPKTNALCRDLVDTSRFKDILPVVGIRDISDAKTGDLIIWKHHVIIFEEISRSIKQDLYVIAWWAGTRYKDNGENVKNNVIYGKYRLKGDFVVRRPVKK